MDISKETVSASSYTAPRNDIPIVEIETEYGSVENWIVRNIRYASTFYNQRVTRRSQVYGSSMPTDNNTMRQHYDTSPVVRMMENFRYYLGEQVNYHYSFLEQAPDGTKISAPFIPGQRVFQVVEFLKGTYASIIRNAKIRCRSTSRDAQTYRERIIALALLKYDYIEEFERVKSAGIELANPLDGIQVKDKKDLLRKAQEEPVERAEIVGNEILQRMLDKYNVLSLAIQSWRHTRIAGPTGLIFRRFGTRIDVQLIPSTHMIIDNRVDDEFNRGARFRGFIEYLTPEEIISRNYREIGSEQRTELYNMVATDAAVGTSLLGSTINFMWSRPSSREIACVTIYFIYLRDTGYYFKRKKDGSIRYPYSYKKSKPGEERSEIMKPVIYQGTLIGDSFLVDYGPLDETFYDPTDPDMPLFPAHFFLPGITNGIIKSSVDRLRDHQDMHDAISFRIRQRISKAHGKIPVIDGSKFDETKTPKSFVQDIVTLGFTVANRANGEDFDPSIQRQGSIAEYLDFTFDSDVNQFLQLKQEEERLMNDMFNTSPVVMGTNKTYVGFNSQNQSISQATLSLANDAENHTQFITNFLQHLLNYSKNFYSTPSGKYEAELFLSPRSLHFLESAKEVAFENLATHVDMRDSMTDIERQQIIAIAQTVLPTGNIEALMALVKIQSMQTKTDVINELEYYSEVQIRRQQQIMEQQMAARQEEIAAQREGQIEKEAVRSAGNMAAKKVEAEGRIANTMVQSATQ